MLVRAGHTEAAVDVSRLAGLNPSGVICEIMREDGTMARLDELMDFARAHGLKIGTIRDLIAYRLKKDHLVERVADCPFTADWGGDWHGADLPQQGAAARADGAHQGRARSVEAGSGADAQPRPLRRRLRRERPEVRPARRGDADDRRGRPGVVVMLHAAAPGSLSRSIDQRSGKPAEDWRRGCATTASARRSSPRSASTT